MGGVEGAAPLSPYKTSKNFGICYLVSDLYPIKKEKKKKKDWLRVI